MAETRTFTGVGSFALSYDYNLAGDVKRITDATNMTINYGYDSGGRLTGVTGSDSLFMGISNYASNFQYRAWGGLKAMTDGGNRTSSLLYNSKLQPTHFEVGGNAVSQNYDYYNDGRIQFVHNTTDANFDRSYSYDFMARLTLATTGATARGETSGNTPYHEGFSYDSWSNLAGRESTTWNLDPLFDGANYTNNRREGWGYDADGRDTTIGTRTYNYDADGQMTLMTGQKWLLDHYVNISQAMGYDGDGEKVKEVLSGQATYYLRSSVLDDAIIEEINSSGQKNVGYVYSPNGELLAGQGPIGESSYITWKKSSPAGTGQYDLIVGGAFGNGAPQRVELDPLGADIGLEAPQPPDTGGGEGDIGGSHSGGLMDARWSNFFNLSAGCSRGGVASSCSGHMIQNNFDSEMRGFFGDNWFDLPGNNNELGRAEAAYERRVSEAFARYTAQQNSKRKPKYPKLKVRTRRLTPKQREEAKRKAQKRRRQDSGKGDSEGGPKYPPVTASEINLITFPGDHLLTVAGNIVDTIVDISNRQACSDAFKKWNLTIPYDVVKSGNLRVAGLLALNQPNAGELLGWSANQVDKARGAFQRRWYHVFSKPNIGEGVFAGIPTVVFNADADFQQLGGLGEVVIHAFIHVGGKHGDPNASPHDLSNFKPGYKEIIDACK